MNKLINRIFCILNLSSIMFLIVGVILAAFPEISLSIISYSIAIILILLGITMMTDSTKTIFMSSFSIGLIALVFGIIILITPAFLTNIITIVLGIIFVVEGISRANLSITIKNIGNERWYCSMIVAIINILCGIMLIIKPSFSAITITSLIGIILIIYSISDIIDILIVKRKIKDISKIFKN